MARRRESSYHALGTRHMAGFLWILEMHREDRRTGTLWASGKHRGTINTSAGQR